MKRFFYSLILTILLMSGSALVFAAAQNYYPTGFPVTENPLSESGNWVNGLTTGTHWQNVQSFGGHIGGTGTNSGCTVGAPNNCNDAVAALTGTWTADQSGCATVYIAAGLVRSGGVGFYESEMHLHQSITSGQATGYEFNYSMFNDGNQYMQIVRWDGFVSGAIKFQVLSSLGQGSGTTPVALNNGDTFCASAIGGVLKSWIVRGGAVIQSSAPAAPDTTYTGGAPGVGFFNGSGVTADNANFGFSSFTATNFAAQTANLSDVNSVASTASNGETVGVPPGTVTWAGGVAASGKGISIIGSGVPSGSPSLFGASSTCAQTQISWAFGSTALFNLDPTFGNSTTRVSCMQITTTTGPNGSPPPLGINGTCTSGGCPNLRLDNLILPLGQICLASDATVANVSNMFGVADHITFGVATDTHPGCNPVLINAGHGRWQGVGGYGDNSWASADTLGSVGAVNGVPAAFYLENNLLNFTMGTDTDIPGADGGGARFACRFNTFNNISSGGVCSGHGTETTGRPRGGLQFEGYFNTGSCPDNSSQGCGSAWPGRSGHGMSFGNAFTNLAGPPVGHFKGIDDFNSQRVFRNVGTWGTCDGLGPAANNVPGAPPGSPPWDTTDGVVYASGTITSITGAGSPGAVITDTGASFSLNQWIDQNFIYVFVDTTLQAGIGTITANTSNSVTVGDCGPCNSPAATHTYAIRKVTACLDQSSRSNGLLMAGDYSSTAPTKYPYLCTNPPSCSTVGSSGPINQVLDPTYEADDSLPLTGPPSDHTIGSDQGNLFTNNRDWYAEGVNQPAQTSVTSPFNGVATTQPITSYVCTNGNLTCVFTVPSTTGFAVNGYGQAVNTAIGSPNPTFGENGQGKITAVTGTTVSLTYPSVASNTGGAGGFVSTQGSGHGTIANRPTTCTTGVAYWATDQGSWNTSGVAGPHGYLNGQLFGCTSTNTWTLIWTPSTYPHPLVTNTAGGGGSVSFSPSSLSFGGVNVGCSPSCPTQTTTLTNSTPSFITLGATTFSPSAGFSQTNNCASTLANGASCTFTVTFNPSGAGAVTSTMSTAFTGVTGSPAQVSLSGTGNLGPPLPPTNFTGVVQ